MREIRKFYDDNDDIVRAVNQKGGKMKFKIEKKGGCYILVDKIGCRPASSAEIYFWKKWKKCISKKREEK